MTKFIHPLEEPTYEELAANAAGALEWVPVQEARETEDGGLMCRRDSQDTLTYLKAGQWRKVQAASA